MDAQSLGGNYNSRAAETPPDHTLLEPLEVAEEVSYLIESPCRGNEEKDTYLL